MDNQEFALVRGEITGLGQRIEDRLAAISDSVDLKLDAVLERMRSGDRESIHAVNLVKEVFELRIKNVESDLQQTLAAHNQRINRIITIAFGVMSACIGIAALLLPIH